MDEMIYKGGEQAPRLPPKLAFLFIQHEPSETPTIVHLIYPLFHSVFFDNLVYDFAVLIVWQIFF